VIPFTLRINFDKSFIKNTLYVNFIKMVETPYKKPNMISLTISEVTDLEFICWGYQTFMEYILNGFKKYL